MIFMPSLRWRVAAWIVSIGLHAAAVAAWTLLCLQDIWILESPGHDAVMPIHAMEVVLPILADGQNAIVGIDKADMLRKIREAADTSTGSTPERLAHLQALATGANAVIAPGSVDAIARQWGLDEHQYVPGPAGGMPDFSTLVFHDIRAVRLPSGEEGVHVVWVDEAGRTVEGDFSGAEAEPYRALVPVFDLIRNNAQLGSIYHRILKPLAGTALREQQAAVPDNPPVPHP